jgi:peptidoglycan/LPS O-acetylase OafA/YrhL
MADATMTDALAARQRIVRLTSILRGLAAILIIVKHTVGRALETSDPVLQPLYVVLHALTECAVPAFLVLSGFSLSLGAGKRPGFRKYAHVVLKRILPAYTLWYFAYRILWGLKNGADLSPRTLIRQYVFLSDNWQLWFLVLLAQLYLLFPLLYRLYRLPKIGKFLIVFAYVAVHFGGAYLGSLAPGALPAVYVSRLFSYFTLYFILGFYLRDYAAAFTSHARAWPVLLGCIAVAGSVKLVEILSIPSYTVLKYLDKPWGIAGIFNLPENVALLVLLYALSESVYARGGRTKAYLSAYGLYSYGIYLAHTLPMALSYSLLRLVFSADNDFVILGNMTATILLSLVLVRWLTRLPLSKYYA